jgi:hypothetical protein
MAIDAGDWLSLGGGLISSLLDEGPEVAREQARAEDLRAREEQARLDAGTIDAYGNVIDRRDPASGALRTTLTGPSKQLADQLLAKENILAQERGDLAATADPLIDEFSQFTGAGGRPGYSLQDAQGEVESRLNLFKNAVLNPAVTGAQRTDARMLGQTSNEGNITARFMERILPQIELAVGGPEEARRLFDEENQRFIENTLGLSERALAGGAAGPSIALPQVASPGDISQQAFAGKSTPPTYPTGNIPSKVGTGVAELGKAFTASDLAAQQATSEGENRKMLERVLKERQNYNLLASNKASPAQSLPPNFLSQQLGPDLFKGA